MNLDTSLNQITTYKDILLINNQENEMLLFFIFACGNFILMIVSMILCFITKKIPIIYDLFGIILGSSLIAMFLNLLFLLPLVFIFNSTTLIYNTGLFLTIAPVFYILYKFKFLNKLGIKLTKLNNNL